ncbi:helix-turn-helix transcriptional regulator [Halegenticoccus tardaugens]|uniref:helix-turn-helix transcriptional regulator n=1 Tax=Halegenticoccus tardaugens TaxID=2071624 RepID=UPI001E5AEE10|nr:hypothetical protein [Halegenticoccus tardaugens]
MFALACVAFVVAATGGGHGTAAATEGPAAPANGATGVDRVGQTQGGIGADGAVNGSGEFVGNLHELGDGAASLVDADAAEHLPAERTRPSEFTLAIFLAHGDLTPHADRPPHHAAQHASSPAQPSSPAWTVVGLAGTLDGIDVVALILSLVTILVSVGLAVYQRFSGVRATPRSIDAPISERERVPTDKDRIRQLVEDHDGRVKQSQIVEQVDWSKAKVSRLLSKLDEEGEITKLRIGRENLICLRGREPPASRSPFSGEVDETRD